VPTPPRLEAFGLPLVAQLFDVPFVPAVKEAPETSKPEKITPKRSSSACAVVEVAPLDGDALVPKAVAVLSSGAPVSPVTEKTCTR
jgi:hypothetical protein